MPRIILLSHIFPRRRRFSLDGVGSIHDNGPDRPRFCNSFSMEEICMLAKTKVTELGIYRRSATVTRGGEVSLAEGRNVLYVSGMTNTANSGSFRLKFPEGVAAANLQIVKAEDVEGFEKQSTAIQEKIVEIDYRIETCKTMSELRKTNGNFTGRSEVSVEEQEKYIDALPEQLLSLHRQIEALQNERKELEEKLSQAVTEEGKPLIMAEIYSAGNVTVPFILQYEETACSWSPEYEVRFSNEAEPLEVSMKARIRQSSKENWLQVKTTLYTGNPSVSQELPEMQSEHVSLYEPPATVDRTPARGEAFGAAANAMPVGMAMAGASPMMGMMGMMQMANLQTAQAEVDEADTMTSFLLPGFKDILSDTEGNIALLQSFRVPARYQVLAIPKLSCKGYLTAEVAASEWPLPSATAKIYIKDTFAGEVYVDADTEKETFNLSLGQDERLSINRTELPSKTSEVFLKNQKKQVRGAVIRLNNSSSEKLKLVIKDQIPVSTDAAITVELAESSGGVPDRETGIISWELQAEPGKAEELKLSYSLAWPKDKKIVERKTPRASAPAPRLLKFCPTCGQPAHARYCPNCGGDCTAG
ncbi:MAG: mucoidy inhibitor MuiA family protein [Ruminococcaceae bacterium]|nr:mucoidy inhibitor MuiA family protein [Oscillospiraceae bacterium]